MIKILAVNAAVSGVISWAAAQLMYVFITFNRKLCQLELPGRSHGCAGMDVLGGVRHAACWNASGCRNYI